MKVVLLILIVLSVELRARIVKLGMGCALPSGNCLIVEGWRYERLVRTDKEYIVVSDAERIAEKLNHQFANKKKSAGPW